jgi:hypothetical protein
MMGGCPMGVHVMGVYLHRKPLQNFWLEHYPEASGNHIHLRHQNAWHANPAHLVR